MKKPQMILWPVEFGNHSSSLSVIQLRKSCGLRRGTALSLPSHGLSTTRQPPSFLPLFLPSAFLLFCVLLILWGPAGHPSITSILEQLTSPSPSSRSPDCLPGRIHPGMTALGISVFSPQRNVPTP